MASSLALLAVLGCGVGFMIGGIGVGGVILVPALTYVGGVPIQESIAAAMMAYVPTGAVGAWIYARRRSIRWPLALWLCLGAMPAALLGAWASSVARPLVLEAAIALLTLGSGLHALRSAAARAEAEPAFGRPALLLIGAVTGFASAMTGTGGPVTLIPILLWLKVPVLAAVGLSQAVQFPIASVATAGNLAYGELDLRLGALLGITVAAGAAVGAHFAHAVPVLLIRRIVAVVLVVVGLTILARIAGLLPTAGAA